MMKVKQQGIVYTSQYKNWQQSVAEILNRAGLSCQIPTGRRILIKPNLVEALKPPITTPAPLVEAIVNYLQVHCPGAEIVIGEGSGAMAYDTWHAYKELGYVDLAARHKIELLDLNEAPLKEKHKKDCRRWPSMHLPELIYDCFLISVPVLKVHTLATVTLTMKNMMGCAPPSHYRRGGSWKKSAFHERIQEAIFDLNLYRTPDFTLLDATRGMREAHLWGPELEPPPNLLAASYDPVAIDSFGSSLLGRKWQEIDHINMAHTVLGVADPLHIIRMPS